MRHVYACETWVCGLKGREQIAGQIRKLRVEQVFLPPRESRQPKREGPALRP